MSGDDVLIVLVGAFQLGFGYWLGWLRWGRHKRTGIMDVPCARCEEGYGAPHACGELDRCPCDQTRYHYNK
jgi:hypothetical protein